MTSIEEFDKAIDLYFKEADINEEVNKAIVTPGRAFLAKGGKRLRPKLFMCVLGCYKDPKPYTKYSVIPEIIHNGTLIIDDIEDSSDCRRGKPTLHVKHGIDIAVNCGNAFYFLPYLIIKHLDVPLKAKIYELINETLLYLHFGQAMDIYWHKNIVIVDDNKYLEMCRMKTGMLTGFSCRLGAIFAGKDLITQHKLEEFGRALGVAFQIQDDILNLTGGEKWTKTLGEDISEGKITLLVIYTCNKASKEDRAKLLEILNMHTTNERYKTQAINIIKKYEAIPYAKGRAQEIVQEAWSDVKDIIPDCESKKELKKLVDVVVDREF